MGLPNVDMGELSKTTVYADSFDPNKVTLGEINFI